MKQIRLKNSIWKIESCQECPCAMFSGVGICKILKAGGIPYNGIRPDCQLEDA